ncbi:aldo/keto reductase [Brevibacillus migulae]|uniref:aldo/keto reductase n=1 Tax=Brevibacillus migulae TaxID=1644114 RepID=UPI00106EEA7C|nr:aldo/keto reductase [Brevibacillus migulae]
MAQPLLESTTLNNGVKLPWLGLGVWRVKEGDEVISSVKHAIQSGYRSIDTAAVYGNEEGVGQAIKESGVAREELFITTKVWNSDQGYESTLQAFETSRKKLGLEYLDLYLIHWPVKGKYVETWKALEKLYKDGLVRAIGVSNHHIHHLNDILEASDIVPAVNQVEFHPLLSQKELLGFCKDKGIQLEAWSPLMQGNLDVPLLAELAEKYQKTPAQIVLRWDLQNGVVTIPKSVTPHRIEENANIFDFTLSAEDMEKIDALNQNKRFGSDPDNFNF